jgi:branched-chain amino acid transport system substrate-binding protein
MTKRQHCAGRTASTSRRRVLQLGAGVAAGAALGFPGILRAQSDKIRIGHLTPMTGFLGALGGWAVLGIRMAAEEINAAGGVLGRQLEVVSEDSINPDAAATKAQRMLERDGVALLMGEINSASALAISQVAARNKRLFLALGPRSDTLRGKTCNRYMFCTDIPNTVMVNAVGTALLRDGKVKDKKFHTVTSDYVFGHDLLRAAKAFFAANGGALAGDELVPTDVTDFSPYLLKIRQSRPDMVCLNLAGNQVTNFVKQYSEFGLSFPTAGFNLNTADAWAAGKGNLTGVWPTVWYHTLDTEGSKAFVAAFQKKHGKVPENHAWIEYIALKLTAQAIAETKSTDTEPLIAHFEKGAEFDILKARKAYFRPWDHQLIQEGYPFTVKDNPADQYDLMVLGPAVPATDQPLEAIYPTKEQNPCSL